LKPAPAAPRQKRNRGDIYRHARKTFAPRDPDGKDQGLRRQMTIDEWITKQNVAYYYHYGPIARSAEKSDSLERRR
jgi:hypothetical protein